MSNKLLASKDEILGVFFLIGKIKEKYANFFSISDQEACKEIESQTETSGERKVSIRSFRRILNFKKEPIISQGKMNDLVYWFTDGGCPYFQRYVDNNIEDILKYNPLTEEELDLLLNKIQNHNIKNQSKDVKISKSSILIHDIESGKNTVISIEKGDSDISISNIKSGNQTKLDI